MNIEKNLLFLFVCLLFSKSAIHGNFSSDTSALTSLCINLGWECTRSHMS